MNTRHTCSFVTFILLAATGSADTVLLKNGDSFTGTITGAENNHVLLLIRPVPELPPVLKRIDKSQTKAIAFEPDPSREDLLQNASLSRIEELRQSWRNMSPFLPMPYSPAARLGLRMGLVLMGKNTPDATAEAFGVFEKIAASAGTSAEREAGEQGKIRALLLENKTTDAAALAENILKSKPGASLEAEASLALAGESARRFREHLEAHPRWTEHPGLKSKHEALLHQTQNLYLRAALLPGISPELSQKGWWGSIEVLQLAGERTAAIETAAELAAMHPESPSAKKAAALINTLSQGEQERLAGPKGTGRENSPPPHHETHVDENANQHPSPREPLEPRPASTKPRKRSRTPRG